MTTEDNQQPVDENALIAERRAKLAALREKGVAFPNDFRPTHKAADLHQEFGGFDAETLEAKAVKVSVAGRMMLKRVMGKAAFATVQDASGRNAEGRIQFFITTDAAGADAMAAFKTWDLGDIIAA